MARSLKNWRVRSRLLLLIIIPTITAVVLGGSRIVTSVQSALGYQRVEQLANMSYDVTGLAARLENERDQTLEYIGEGTAGRPGTLGHNTKDGAPQNLQLVAQDQSLTAPWLRKVRADSAAIGATVQAPSFRSRQDARTTSARPAEAAAVAADGVHDHAAACDPGARPVRLDDR